MEMLQREVLNLVILIIAVCVSLITKSLMAYLGKKGIIAKIQGHKELTNIIVNGVEQGYKALNGNEKFDLAKIELLKIANEKGLKITDKEIDLLIESAVGEMKKNI